MKRWILCGFFGGYWLITVVAGLFNLDNPNMVMASTGLLSLLCCVVMMVVAPWHGKVECAQTTVPPKNSQKSTEPSKSLQEVYFGGPRQTAGLIVLSIAVGVLAIIVLGPICEGRWS